MSEDLQVVQGNYRMDARLRDMVTHAAAAADVPSNIYIVQVLHRHFRGAGSDQLQVVAASDDVVKAANARRALELWDDYEEFLTDFATALAAREGDG